MTTADIPANPSVLNTTVLSNFASIDQLWVVGGLSGICTVPAVREELESGVDEYPYLQAALDTLDDEIPVAPISDTVANREAVVSSHLDPDEAQAFALADAHDGPLLTDDGDARSFAKEQGVTVVGSVGILLAAIDAGKIDEPTADEWGRPAKRTLTSMPKSSASDWTVSWRTSNPQLTWAERLRCRFSKARCLSFLAVSKTRCFST